MIQQKSPSNTRSELSPIVYPKHLLLPDDAVIVYERRKNSDRHAPNQQSEKTLPSQAKPERLQDEVESSPQSSYDPELDLPIAQRKGVRSCTQHPLRNYISYSNLSPKFQAFVTSLDSINVPNYVYEALKVLE